MKPKYTTLLLDLDGTVYAGDAEVPGAADFIRRCEAAGVRCHFVTNRSNRTRDADAGRSPPSRNDPSLSSMTSAG